jgi:hypothetical protein
MGKTGVAKVTRLKGEIMPLKKLRKGLKKLQKPAEVPEPKKVPAHWNLITSCSPTRCAICDKKSKKGTRLDYWGKHKETGDDMFRHKHCFAGSANWIKKFNGWVNKDLQKILGNKPIQEEENETTETKKRKAEKCHEKSSNISHHKKGRVRILKKLGKKKS